jgi:hypothetical protein
MKMKPVLLLCAAIALLAATLLAAPPPQTTEKTQALRGWVSDEKCARSHARDGIYTATNPDCTKDCVAKGIKIVLIDPKGKRILLLANQDAGKDHLGDYVEVSGVLDSEAMTLQIDKLKVLLKASAKHGTPPPNQPTS